MASPTPPQAILVAGGKAGMFNGVHHSKRRRNGNHRTETAMILDVIIAVFGMLLAAVAVPFIALANLLAAVIEAVVGIFVDGFELGRIKRKNREEKSRRRRTGEAVGGLVVVLVVVGLAVFWILGSKRQVTLVATDGHSLPFAGVILDTGSGPRHLRTDEAGNFSVPRFGLRSVTVKDPRYVERTWRKSEVGRTLTVQRSSVGTVLDRAIDFLKEKKSDEADGEER